MLFVAILLFVLIYYLYKWSVEKFGTFTERGVPHEKPIPLIGNALPLLKTDGSFHKTMWNSYKRNKQHKVYGYYHFREPIFIINDPELIKKMGVKDFDSFANHQRMFNTENDPLLEGMLTVMKDQRWKDMRNTVTPIFTGAKMRAMFVLMNDCFVEGMKYLRDQLEGKDSFDIELKDYFTRLSNDLIATTAFGLKLNSFENKNNEFYTIGKTVTKFKGKQALKFMLYAVFPKIFEIFNIESFDKKKTDYFVRLVVDAMKYREEHNIVRPDMIHLLMEAKKESEHHWSEEEIVAQCFIFFFAAFENNANLLGTTCHELMENPDVQNKLYDEIMDFHKELDGKTLDYDTLHRMKYLDMVLSESLRKWSITALTDRECGKDYTVVDDNGNFICELKKGDRVWYQIFGLHRDEEYFDHPDVFDPERFSDENKSNIKPFTYLPFGLGPRICIGNRYALMQAKAMLFYILKDFKLERSEKTCSSMLDDMSGFQLTPKNGFWVKMSQRKLI